ncbi:hypothetical protein SAMN04487905_11235 [Actinopolyspora xinjiangensis]|uniref:Uncharacterized protein n=1 Tax=Actinopolyspora xinjiangensis TaxID=405564 RepID=A0A1H0WFU9_9ACTN|nr:hypothetical protein SAMN04487905_11235 [Actinopolyspora xinjiangensis]
MSSLRRSLNRKVFPDGYVGVPERSRWFRDGSGFEGREHVSRDHDESDYPALVCLVAV